MHINESHDEKFPDSESIFLVKLLTKSNRRVIIWAFRQDYLLFVALCVSKDQPDNVNIESVSLFRAHYFCLHKLNHLLLFLILM